MRGKVVDKAIDFIERISLTGEKIHIASHGGKPFLIEKEYYESILTRLKERSGKKPRLSIQSNLSELDGNMIQTNGTL